MSDQDSTPSADDQSSNEEASSPTSSEVSEASVDSVADKLPKAAPAEGIALGMGGLAESDERTMGLLSHLLGAFTSFVAPLIIWLIKKDESPFVDDQGKEALNFQITVGIGYLVAGILSAVPIVQCLSLILFPVIGIFSLIYSILGGMAANKGIAYRYPFCLRLIS